LTIRIQRAIQLILQRTRPKVEMTQTQRMIQMPPMPPIPEMQQTEPPPLHLVLLGTPHPAVQPMIQMVLMLQHLLMSLK
jgi:hypothetical protein